VVALLIAVVESLECTTAMDETENRTAPNATQARSTVKNGCRMICLFVVG
jgi:hypothetical protein